MKTLLAIVLVAISTQIFAESRINIHLRSIHTEPGFHEENYGFGVEFDYKSVHLVGGALINSYKKAAIYGGLGQRWKTGHAAWIGVGYMAGVIYYEQPMGYITTLAILPELSLGYNDIALSMIVIPRIEYKKEETTPAILFSVRMPTKWGAR